MTHPAVPSRHLALPFHACAGVRNNVKAYGGDPDLIVVSGHSAGGNIAALLAVGGDDWLDEDSRAVSERACDSVRD